MNFMDQQGRTSRVDKQESVTQGLLSIGFTEIVPEFPEADPGSIASGNKKEHYYTEKF